MAKVPFDGQSRKKNEMKLILPKLRCAGVWNPESYYSVFDPFGQGLQYISIKFFLLIVDEREHQKV